MQRKPRVHRDHSGGLTGDCARSWCLFLQEEAEFNDDQELLEFCQSMLKGMSVCLPASVSAGILEDSIKAWNGGRV